MKQYEIYKSEGGYRVAAELCNGGPVLKSSPWFAKRAIAAMWRANKIARDYNYQWEQYQKKPRVIKEN